MSDRPAGPVPGPPTPLRIRAITPADRAWIASLLVAHWGSTVMVTRGRRHEAGDLAGFVAEVDGERRGVLLHALAQPSDPAAVRGQPPPADELEVVLLESLVERRGTGSALLAAAEELARAHGARRIWLVTTNDNQPAIDFYTRRGYRLVAIHAGAVTAARRLKPEIPARGLGDVPITDEIELERRL